MIMTTDEIPFPYYDYISVRIEFDGSNPHHPLQRHIWTKRDGTVEEEAWIRSVNIPLVNGHPIAEPTL